MFLKCNFLFLAVVNFNSYHGCQKCTVRGLYSKQYKVMSFPNTSAAERTNNSFRLREQKEHHHPERSAVERLLCVDMVKDFPIADALHLLELGITKRCLTRWKEGTKSYKNRFKAAELNQINTSLNRARESMPTEIHRSIRNLDTLHFWKGTEFRTILLYVGIVVLKDIVAVDEYNHFKLLSCATILCSSDAYELIVNSTSVVDELINAYIEQYIILYGEHTISSNVHNLSHLLDDVRRFGNLNSLSTYPFENCLQMIKSKLRAMKNPLQEISRRMTEISSAIVLEPLIIEKKRSNLAELKFPFTGDKSKFRAVILSDYRISSKKIGDRWFMTNRKQVLSFQYATYAGRKILLHGYELCNKEIFFTKPLDSSKLNIYISDGQTADIETVCEIADIKCKMVCLPYNSQIVLQPLLHTLH